MRHWLRHELSWWLLAAAVGIMVIMATPVRAHSWYDPACCSEHDCAPLDATPRPAPGGYTALGHFFPKEMLRPSRDNRWHACIRGGRPLCLYAPMGS